MPENQDKFAESLMESGQLGHVDTHDSPSVNLPPSRWWAVRQKLRKAAAEFLGTAILTTFGFGAVVQLALTPSSSWAAMVFVWGLAVTVAIYATAGVSGAALNPAVTLVMAVFRGFDWVDVPIYWAAQCAGAFAGAFLTYVLNWSVIHEAELQATIGLFITGPSKGTSTGVAFLTEVVGTALLLFVVLATSEGRGITPVDPRFQPVVVGMAVTVIGLGIGTQSGFALNPARDLGPRIFTAIAGWGSTAFTRQGYYFWVPIVAPTLGAFCGAIAHDLLAYNK